MIHYTTQGIYTLNLPLFCWAERQYSNAKMKAKYRQLISRYNLTPAMAAAIANNLQGGCYE